MLLFASCESLVEFNFVTLYGTYFDTDYVIVDRDTQDVLTLQQTFTTNTWGIRLSITHQTTKSLIARPLSGKS